MEIERDIGEEIIMKLKDLLTMIEKKNKRIKELEEKNGRNELAHTPNARNKRIGRD